MSMPDAAARADAATRLDPELVRQIEAIDEPGEWRAARLSELVRLRLQLDDAIRRLDLAAATAATEAARKVPNVGWTPAMTERVPPASATPDQVRSGVRGRSLLGDQEHLQRRRGSWQGWRRASGR